MEGVKKERSSKARTLTRRTKELFNAIKNGASVIEVKEKISIVKMWVTPKYRIGGNYRTVGGNSSMKNTRKLVKRWRNGI